MAQTYSYDYDDVIKTIKGNTSVYDTSVELEKTELIVSGCSLVFQGSVKGVGIFGYNAKTRVFQSFIEGTEDYRIKKLEGNTLFYDDTKLELM